MNSAEILKVFIRPNAVPLCINFWKIQEIPLDRLALYFFFESKTSESYPNFLTTTIQKKVYVGNSTLTYFFHKINKKRTIK